jgi:hypothetical protein
MIVQRQTAEKAIKVARLQRRRGVLGQYTEELRDWAREWENVGFVPNLERALEGERKPIS